jgi:hypothetical protein
MDGDRFDRLAVALTRAGTRRSVLGLLGALGLTGLRARDVAGQTCLADGARCDPNASSNGCCSGKCSRRRKKCRPAPGQGICTVEDDHCATATSTCDEAGLGSCHCWVTTRGYIFCGSGSFDCFACETDGDCARRPGGQRGDRCVECSWNGCEDTNGRHCHFKCPNPA